MGQKPARAQSSGVPKKDTSGFVALPVLLLIAIGVALVAKSAYDKSHVLGESSLIAQVPPSGETAPAPQTQSAPQTQESHPQESAPAPQQAPQQSAPAPQTGTGGSTSTQQWSGSTSPQTGSGTSGQQQYQQHSPEQQKQTYQQYQQQGEQQRSQQYQGTGQGGNQGQGTQQGNQPFQQGQAGQQQGPQGQPGAVGPGNQTQQPYVPQFSEKQYQEFQKHYEQEAGKFGFQLNGSLPPQFLDHQNFPSQGQRGQGGAGNTGAGNTGTGGQNQTGQNLSSFLRSLPPVNAFPTIQGKFNVGTTTGGQEVNLNDTNTRVQLWGAQGANSPLAVIRPDGTQVQINKAELEKINAAMKLTTGSEVSQNGDKFSLRRGQVEAETHLPISFNVATKTFTVQTPNGEKELHVLPDTAAQKLVENHVFSELQTSTTTGEGGTTTTQAKVVLTQLNDKPVYEVEGASKQKFLGFAQISIPKTVFVSAETGDSVKTQQTFTSQILDLLSF